MLFSLLTTSFLAVIPSQDHSFTLTLSTPESSSSPFPLNHTTSLVAHIAPNAAPSGPAAPPTLTSPTLDARMPAHDHGMALTPRVTSTAPGELRIDGVNLHMAGHWDLTLTVQTANPQTGIDQPTVFVVPIDL